MTLHQPMMARHRFPAWLELVGAAIIGAALVFGALLVAGHTDLLPSTATRETPAMIVAGTGQGSLAYTGIPYPPRQVAAVAVSGTSGGSIQYTGIPYAAAAADTVAVSGTSGGSIQYTGIPYPDSSAVGGTSGAKRR